MKNLFPPKAFTNTSCTTNPNTSIWTSQNILAQNFLGEKITLDFEDFEELQIYLNFQDESISIPGIGKTSIT